jgi:hypothetical protein
LADTYGFNIARITPLANDCVPQAQASQHWLMVAEPQRLLFVRCEAGAWQQIWVDVPPSGAEQQHAEQLVQRTLVQMPPQQRPARISVFVSAELQPHWQKNAQSVLHVVNQINQQAPHSVWMGRL